MTGDGEKTAEKRRKNNKSGGKRVGLLRVLVTAAIFLVVFGTVFILVFYGDSVSSDMWSFFPISCAPFGQAGGIDDVDIIFDASRDNFYHSMKNGFAVLSPDGLRIYNWSGRETLLYQPRMKNAAFSASGERCVVYDTEGNTFAITDDSSVLMTGSAEGQITSARYFDNGSCVIISAGDKYRYKGEVSVRGSDLKETFKWHSSKRYVADAALSDNGRRLAVLCLDQEEGRLKSSVVLFDLGQTEPLAEVHIYDSMPICAGFFGDGGFFALMEDSAVFYDADGEKLGTVFLTGRYLKGYDAEKDDITLLLSRYEAGGRNELITYSPDGTEKFRIGLEDEAASFDRMGRNTAVLHSERVTVYGENGEVIGEREDAADVSSVIMYDEGSVIFVCESTMRIYRP